MKPGYRLAGAWAVVALFLVGCGTSVPAGIPFRSDQFHLQVTLPPGWAAAEGPKPLKQPFVGLVAFTSWGEADFWAPALSEGDISSYFPTSLAEVPEGEAYVLLVYYRGRPAAVEYGPEHTSEDLSSVWEPRDCRQGQAGGSTWINFNKWGRLFSLGVYCQPDASEATAAAVDNLISSWRFDPMLPGDPGWASAQARALLPAVVHPEWFAVLFGEFVGEGAFHASMAKGIATRITRAEVQGEAVVVTFALRRDDLPSKNGDECPHDRCHWWRFEARASGKDRQSPEIILVEEGGAALSSLPVQGTWTKYSDPALGFAVEYPSDWDVITPEAGVDELGRARTAIGFQSALNGYGEQAFPQYGIYIGVTPQLGQTVTQTVESMLGPAGTVYHLESRCCLSIGGEPAIDLPDYPPIRWGNRVIIVLHEGREYRLNFHPQQTLDGNTPADAEARTAFDAFLNTFAFVPITVTAVPLTPTVAPVPTAAPIPRTPATSWP